MHNFSPLVKQARSKQKQTIRMNL